MKNLGQRCERFVKTRKRQVQIPLDPDPVALQSLSWICPSSVGLTLIEFVTNETLY